MTSADIVDRLSVKVKWAKQHIERLEAATAKLILPEESEEFVRVEDDHQAEERSYYVRQVPLVPLEIPLLIGDALQNLRSALDHLACHLVTVGGGVVGAQTYFPIAKDAATYYSADFRGRIKGMVPAAVRAIDDFKPYKGGDFFLWELHELNKIDKHRLLLTVCTANSAHSMTPSQRVALEQTFRDSHPGQDAPYLGHVLLHIDPVPLKVGDKLLTISHAEMENQMKFLIDIAFDEPQILRCQSVTEKLLLMSNTVMAIIAGFAQKSLL